MFRKGDVDRGPETLDGIQLQVHQEESLLLSRARTGSRTAQDVLFGHFQPLVTNYLRRKMGPHVARYVSVEDLTQEVFTRAIRAVGSLRESATLGDLRGILLQHANWVILERGRQAGDFAGESMHLPPGEGTEGRAAPEPAASAHSTGPVTHMDQREWILGRAAQLAPKYAEVLRLYLKGKRFAEIAEELEIEERTARKRFLRAAEQLRARTSPERDG